MEKVNELVQEIKKNITQVTASQKDEVRVMRAMMNDKEYVVDVYGKDGVEGTFCPSQAVRAMSASIMASAAKIPQAEAAALMDIYEFKKGEATNLVEVSKEFVNTYVHTGRKLPLGGREKSDVSVGLKEIEAGMRPYPKQVGVDGAGKAIYGRGEAYVGPYESLKVFAPCPTWTK